MDIVELNKHWAFRMSAHQNGRPMRFFATAKAAGRRPASLAVSQALIADGIDADPEPQIDWSGPLKTLQVASLQHAALSAQQGVVIAPKQLAGVADAALDGRFKATSRKTCTPLDAQTGIFPRKSIPDDLHDLVCGNPELGPCYALVDGAAVPEVETRLGSSGLHHQCLFKGGGLERFGDSAPWLVQLEPDADLTRALFTDLPGDPLGRGLWGQASAIFVRSPVSLEGLVAHFRHFTQLVDPASGQSLFFRFYAPDTLRTIIANMAPDDLVKFGQGVARFFCTDGRGGVFVLEREAG